MRAVAVCLVLLVSCAPSKEQFIERFEHMMVKWFCDSDGRARNCYVIDETRCVDMARRALAPCTEKYKSQMPERFDEESGRQIGERIGGCTGLAFEVEIIRDYKRADPWPAKCDDPKAWLPK